MESTDVQLRSLHRLNVGSLCLDRLYDLLVLLCRILVVVGTLREVIDDK